DPAQVAWSPSRRQVLLQRRLPACAKPARRGELHLYDARARRLFRVARAFGSFHPIWLDEETFAYEDGLGEKAGVRIWHRGTVQALEIPHGAGLRAVPEPAFCPEVGKPPSRSEHSHP